MRLRLIQHRFNLVDSDTQSEGFCCVDQYSLFSQSTVQWLVDADAQAKMAKKAGISGKAKSKVKAKTLRFCLVRWLEDETVSVVPATSADGKLSVGEMRSFKWIRKLYDAEVLRLSDEFG